MTTVLVARSIGAPGRGLRWLVNPIPRERRHVTLVALLNVDNDACQEVYVFPRMDRKKRFHINTGNVWLKGGKRLSSLEDFREAVKVIAQKRRPIGRPSLRTAVN